MVKTLHFIQTCYKRPLYINVIYFVVDYYHILCVLNYNDSNVSNSDYYHHHNHHQKQDLCSIIDKYISEGYLVIYAAECNTPTQPVVQNMIQNRINADNLTKDTSLIITNPDIIYCIEKCTNAKMMLEAQKSFIFNLRKNESLTKDKIVMIITPEQFFERGIYTLYLDYERLLADDNTIINSEFNNVLFEKICCYDVNLIEKLSFADLIHLLNAHSYTIHKGDIYTEWCQQKLLNLVHRGVIKAIGDTSENIMFKVLEIVFDREEEYSIIIKPDIFENRVRKMMGEKVADIVFSNISREIMKEIIFNQDVL